MEGNEREDRICKNVGRELRMKSIFLTMCTKLDLQSLDERGRGS